MDLQAFLLDHSSLINNFLYAKSIQNAPNGAVIKIATNRINITSRKCGIYGIHQNLLHVRLKQSSFLELARFSHLAFRHRVFRPCLFLRYIARCVILSVISFRRMTSDI